MPSTFIPQQEIDRRIQRLQHSLGRTDLDGILVFEYINLLYYTGTIQNGVLFIPRSGSPLFFVRRSITRAKAESPLKEIIPFKSFRELPAHFEAHQYAYVKIGIDETTLPLNIYNLLKKHLGQTEFHDAGLILKQVRSVKSAYEIRKQQKAGDISREICTLIPGLLVPGITEWELGLKLFHELTIRANTCFGRLSFNSGEFFIGNVCFGESALYPCAFDGPGGIVGKSPVCPFVGSDRKLKKADLVYVDIAYSFEEYYVDKTRVFSLGKPDNEIMEMHARCLEIQEAVRKRLRPGEISSAVFEDILRDIVMPAHFEENFMGYQGNQVKFLGHGIGMVINEYPVIAKRFDEPLKENMVIAVEPKKGIDGKGMVGIENTFVVTKTGGESLTHDSDEIVII